MWVVLKSHSSPRAPPRGRHLDCITTQFFPSAPCCLPSLPQVLIPKEGPNNHPACCFLVNPTCDYRTEKEADTEYVIKQIPLWVSGTLSHQKTLRNSIEQVPQSYPIQGVKGQRYSLAEDIIPSYNWLTHPMHRQSRLQLPQKSSGKKLLAGWESGWSAWKQEMPMDLGRPLSSQLPATCSNESLRGIILPNE